MSGAMEQYLLGIDIGTSACKVAVFDENGQVKLVCHTDRRGREGSGQYAYLDGYEGCRHL